MFQPVIKKMIRDLLHITDFKWNANVLTASQTCLAWRNLSFLFLSILCPHTCGSRGCQSDRCQRKAVTVWKKRMSWQWNWRHLHGNKTWPIDACKTGHTHTVHAHPHSVPSLFICPSIKPVTLLLCKCLTYKLQCPRPFETFLKLSCKALSYEHLVCFEELF